MVSRDGRHIAAVDGPRVTLRVWRLTQAEPQSWGLTFPDSIRSLAWREDGKVLAIQHRFGNVKLLRPFTTTKSPKNIAVVPRGVTGQMAFGPRGAYLATSQRDAVTVWDTETHEDPLEIPGASRFAFRPDGQRLATDGLDGIVQVWDLVRRRSVISLDRRSSFQIRSLSYSPDGSHLAVLDEAKRVSIWQLDDSTAAFCVPVPDAAFVTYGRRGRLLCCLTRRGARILDTRDGRQVFAFR